MSKINSTEEQSFLDELDKRRALRDSLPDRIAHRVDVEVSSNHAILSLVFLNSVISLN